MSTGRPDHLLLTRLCRCRHVRIEPRLPATGTLARLTAPRRGCQLNVYTRVAYQRVSTLHVVTQTIPVDVSGRLHIPSGQSECNGKGEGHLRQSQVSGKSFVDMVEIQRLLGICCATCQLSLRVPQRRQGYQTTSESALAHRPGVTRAARTQKYRAVDDEKAAPAFSLWYMLQAEKTAQSSLRQVSAAQQRHR